MPKVGKSIYIHNNHLTSLKGSPEIVDGHFICSDNSLFNLDYSPIEVRGTFNCRSNKINSTKNMPCEIRNHFLCNGNPNLKDLDSVSNIEGVIQCDKDVDTYNFRGYCNNIMYK
jgi:hypothetical protein